MKRRKTTNTKDAAAEKELLIAARKYKVSELETLKLQKLMHQNNSLAREHMRLQEAMQRAFGDAQRAQAQFTEYLGEVKKAHGLGDEHDIMLDDQFGGTVVKTERPSLGTPAQASEPEQEAK